MTVENADPRDARLLVTGATGFIGRHLLRHLTDVGLSPVAAVRRSPSASAAVAGAEYKVVGDIGPDTDWSEALTGVSAVIHAAARVHVHDQDDPGAFFRVNEAGTIRLARAAAEHGVRRLVFLSSIKVNGEATSDVPFRAGDVPRPLDPYGRSKLAAERALWRESERSGLEIVVVRPPLVYGPGVGANFRRLMNWVQRGLPLPFGAVRNQRSMISVGTLASLLRHVASDSRAAGRVWLASDGRDFSTPELVELLASCMGRSSGLLAVPVPLIRGLAVLIGRGDEVRRLTDSLQVDSEPMVAELGFRRPEDAAKAIAMTVEAFRRESKTDGS